MFVTIYRIYGKTYVCFDMKKAKKVRFNFLIDPVDLEKMEKKAQLIEDGNTSAWLRKLIKENIKDIEL